MNEEAHDLEQFCVDCQDETDQQMTPEESTSTLSCPTSQLRESSTAPATRHPDCATAHAAARRELPTSVSDRGRVRCSHAWQANSLALDHILDVGPRPWRTNPMQGAAVEAAWLTRRITSECSVDGCRSVPSAGLRSGLCLTRG